MKSYRLRNLRRGLIALVIGAGLFFGLESYVRHELNTTDAESRRQLNLARDPVAYVLFLPALTCGIAGVWLLFCAVVQNPKQRG